MGGDEKRLAGSQQNVLSNSSVVWYDIAGVAAGCSTAHSHPRDSSGVGSCLAHTDSLTARASDEERPSQNYRSVSPITGSFASPRLLESADYGFVSRRKIVGSPRSTSPSLADNDAEQMEQGGIGLHRRGGPRSPDSTGMWQCLRGGSLPPSLETEQAMIISAAGCFPSRFGGMTGSLFARDPEYGLTRRGARKTLPSPDMWRSLRGDTLPVDHPSDENDQLSSAGTRTSSHSPRRVRKPPAPEEPMAHQRNGDDVRKLLQQTPLTPRRRSLPKNYEVPRSTTGSHMSLFDGPKSTDSVFTRSTSPGGSQGGSLSNSSSVKSGRHTRLGKSESAHSLSKQAQDPPQRSGWPHHQHFIQGHSPSVTSSPSPASSHRSLRLGGSASATVLNMAPTSPLLASVSDESAQLMPLRPPSSPPSAREASTWNSCSSPRNSAPSVSSVADAMSNCSASLEKLGDVARGLAKAGSCDGFSWPFQSGDSTRATLPLPQGRFIRRPGEPAELRPPRTEPQPAILQPPRSVPQKGEFTAPPRWNVEAQNFFERSSAQDTAQPKLDFWRGS